MVSEWAMLIEGPLALATKRSLVWHAPWDGHFACMLIFWIIGIVA